MKKWLYAIWLLLGLYSIKSTAQDTQELKTQALQIGYLKIYGELIWEGYKIARAGLNLIGDIKNKDFLQHKNYFKSLATVSSAVRKSPRASRVVELGKHVMMVYYRDWPKIQASGRLDKSEKDYVYGVYQRIIKNSQDELSELDNLLTDDKLTMKDGERLERLERILEQMEGNKHFMSRFSGQVLMLDALRSSSQKESGLLTELLTENDL